MVVVASSYFSSVEFRSRKRAVKADTLPPFPHSLTLCAITATHSVFFPSSLHLHLLFLFPPISERARTKICSIWYFPSLPFPPAGFRFPSKHHFLHTCMHHHQREWTDGDASAGRKKDFCPISKWKRRDSFAAASLDAVRVVHVAILTLRTE